MLGINCSNKTALRYFNSTIKAGVNIKIRNKNRANIPLKQELFL